jgi:zinc transport system permease protein
MGRDAKINGDSAIALMSASALAIGTFVVSLSGTNVDINSYLFGSILSIDWAEVVLSGVLFVVVLLAYLILRNRIFAITFDERFAKSIGLNTELYNIMFAILCSVVVVVGMRLMGALLISSIIVFPVLSAQALHKSFNKVILSSVFLSVLSFVLGLVFSYLLATPTGATIVIVNLGILMILKISERVLR